jgi:hypothetical protein
VFGRESDERTVPTEVEFPFRGTTTVEELQNFYSVRIDAPASATLDEVMRNKLGAEETKVDAMVEFESLRFRVQKVSADGRIELVGMSILEDEPGNESGNGNGQTTTNGHE